MGWFSSLVSGAVSAVKSVAKAVVGNLGGMVKNAYNWLKENVLGLGETPKYDVNNATTEETIKINELLRECIDKYSDTTKEFDNTAKPIVEEEFNNIRKLLESLNSNDNKVIEEHIFEKFEYELENIKTELDGVYSKKIENAFSLNNNELLKILNKPAGKEKKNAINEFAIASLEEAHNNLEYEIEKAVGKQRTHIKKKLNEYVEDKRNTLENSKRETDKILDSLDEDINKKNILAEEYKSNIEMLEILDSLIGGEY